MRSAPTDRRGRDVRPCPPALAPIHAGLLAALVATASPVGADLVAYLVPQVSVTNLQAHIQALEYPRDTPARQALAADYVAATLEGFGYAVTLDPVQTSTNVVARRQGAVAAERIVVVGAHFDSVPGSPGADDNAGGIAALLELARLTATIEPDQTVELVAFALEEVGRVGSIHHAQQAAAANAQITAMLCFEMIGYTCDTMGCQVPFSDIPGCLDVDPEGVDVGTFIADLGNDASSELMHAFAAAAALYVPDLQVGTAQVAGTGTCFPSSRRSDHSPFWDQGYRALMLTDTAEYRNPHYHQPTDTLDTLDLDFARRVTQAALATVLIEAGTSTVFRDDFERSDTSAWTVAVP